MTKGEEMPPHNEIIEPEGSLQRSDSEPQSHRPDQLNSATQLASKKAIAKKKNEKPSKKEKVEDSLEEP